MDIQQSLIPADKFSLKCPNPMTPIGLCVHNTANDASAKSEISYMSTNALQTSFHIAVDDFGAIQGLPLDRNGWHAGDGANGTGNRKYIGIEICYSKTGGPRFTKAEANAAELIAQMLKERGWGIDRVKKHQDFSNKYCPHRTLDLGWDRFLELVKTNLGGTMPETIQVEKKDWERVRHASELGDRLVTGLNVDDSELYKGNIADKSEADIDKMAKQAKDDHQGAQNQDQALAKQKEELEKDAENRLKLQAEQLGKEKEDAVKKAHDEGFEEGKQSVPTSPTNPELPNQPPEIITLDDGSQWLRNGLTYEGGKLVGNYTRKLAL